MERVAYGDRALSGMHKELIAVGISVAIDCESCMQWHIEQARAKGADFDQVLEAVEVGIEMGGGPATVSARFALEVMDAVFPKATQQAVEKRQSAAFSELQASLRALQDLTPQVLRKNPDRLCMRNTLRALDFFTSYRCCPHP